MGKISGKLIIIFCILLCVEQSVGAAAEQSFDIITEKTAPSSVVIPKQSMQKADRSDSVTVIRWHRWKRRISELKSLAEYTYKAIPFFSINFYEEEARPLHLFQALRMFEDNLLLRGLDCRSPEIEIDFYQPDIIGLGSFLEKRRGMPFEFKIRHHSRRPFPSFSTPEESPMALISTVLREVTVNPYFSITIEDAPDDIKLALFRARCSTAHGRESLMKEIASKQETINARAEFFKHHRPVRKMSDVSCAEEHSDSDKTIRKKDGRPESDHSSDTDDTMG